MNVNETLVQTDRKITLDVRGMHVHFETRRGLARAVNGVDLQLYEGERFGLVGESGSGKTTLILALLRMIRPPGRITGGQALLDGEDLMKLSEEKMRQARLAKISLAPQAAMNSLNPVMRVGKQIIMAMKAHGERGDAPAMRKRVAALLDSVGLKPETARLFPHELSGGMKQRVCIAMAVSLEPRLILADEPTSALDVVVQRRIMQTLCDLQTRMNASVLLVGHDMGLMAQFAQRIGIMYGGKLVEVGPVKEIFENPKHPYTQLLISSIPTFKTRGTFKGIPGVGLSLLNSPTGCLFHPRCPKVMDRCSLRSPQLREVAPGCQAACFLYEEDEDASSS